jgi:hypothetical protein
MPPEATKSVVSSPAESPRIHKPDAVQPSASSASAVTEVADSWRRCMLDYHVDPKSRSAPNVVTQGELRAHKEPTDAVIAQAREEIDRLYAIVRQEGYVVLLCSTEGVAVHHRGEESRAQDFKDWGIWLGVVCGPNKSKAPTVSAHASPNSGRFWSTVASTFVRGTANSLAPERRFSMPKLNWLAFWMFPQWPLKDRIGRNT